MTKYFERLNIGYMSRETERPLTQPVDHELLEYAPNTVRVPLEIMKLAREKGCSLYLPQLQRDQHSSEERTQDADEAVHIVTRTTIAPPLLYEFRELPKIPMEWQKYRGEFLLQGEENAYILALSTQLIGPFHPAESPILLSFVSVASVLRLNAQMNEDQEKEWRSEVQKKTPRPTWERFRLAQIENNIEGMLVEMQDTGNFHITLNSEDQFLREAAEILRQFKR